MSNKNWADGPWHVCCHDNKVWITDRDDNAALARVMHARHDGAENAHLMAAAPKLYDALGIAREYVAKVHGSIAGLSGGDSIVKPDLDMIDEAMAEARGEVGK